MQIPEIGTPVKSLSPQPEMTPETSPRITETAQKAFDGAIWYIRFCTNQSWETCTLALKNANGDPSKAIEAIQQAFAMAYPMYGRF